MGNDVLQGFDRRSFTFDGKTRDVFRSGSGPAVVVIAEMPGITPKVVEFAKKVEALGCTVALPHLFGEPGRDPYRKGMRSAIPYVLSSMAPACVSHDFHALATGKTSPVIEWLRALARSLHEECGGPGVGAVGMCFTGGFALAMIADAPVLAPVLSQPSLPFPIGAARKRDLGLSDADLEKVKSKCAADDLKVVGLRFTGDRVVPAERFARLREELGDRFVGVDIDSSKGNPYGHRAAAHSVLTEDLQDEPGTPTRDALDQVLELFRSKLLT
ncbi:MAG TPA: dienelactone hydrolase family protein [Acidimicrobiales bacterium]|jgi:dienelactone hydrolase|nr:dienelactone hydrolase family protein [Acidimicrobiales bacterium]